MNEDVDLDEAIEAALGVYYGVGEGSQIHEPAVIAAIRAAAPIIVAKARAEADRNGYGETPAEYWNRRFQETCARLDEDAAQIVEQSARLAEVERERDEARAEVEHVKARSAWFRLIRPNADQTHRTPAPKKDT